VSTPDPLMSDDEATFRLAVADIRFDAALAANEIPEERLRECVAWHRSELVKFARVVFGYATELAGGATWETCREDDVVVSTGLALREMSEALLNAVWIVSPSVDPPDGEVL
jgi:hypothetical protein